MKKTIICIFSFLCIFILSAYAQNSKDYFELNKIEKVNGIVIVNQQRGITLRLNEEQAETLIKNLKFPRNCNQRKSFILIQLKYIMRTKIFLL